MESKKPKVPKRDKDSGHKEKEEQTQENIPFQRSRQKHKTIQPTIQRKQVQEQLKTLEKLKEGKGQLETIPEKFQRKNMHSKSLIEKSKNLGSLIFRNELKLKVALNSLIDETQGLPTNKYKVLSIIGEGSFGTVYKAENLVTHTQVAIKKISKSEENKIDDSEVNNEILILKNLDHPNIAKIIEFYSTPRSYYLIQSYCPLGELYDQLKFKFDENQLAVLFYQIFSGLAYLHSKNIFHRDLKLENIMIQEIETDFVTGKKYMWVKIIDFGAAKTFAKHMTAKAIVGSSYYIAPEVLKQSYNEKCDIWSVGVILYMLIVGRAPFDGQDDDEILESIKRGKYNTRHPKLISSSDEVRDLIYHLLLIDPDKRYSAAKALKHPWFKKFEGKKLYYNIQEDTIRKYVDRLYDYPFHINYKLQQMVLAFITHNLPDTGETKDILKIFRQFNENDDGKLTKEELRNGLIKYKNKETVDKEIDDIFMVLDGANKGFIEFEEFLRACMDQSYITNDDNLTYAFNFFTKDNSNKIKIENLQKIFAADDCSEENFKKIFAEIDLNGDGVIDFSEFCAMMKGY